MSFYDTIVDDDFLTLMKPLLDSGNYMIDPEDGKIHNKEERKGNAALNPNKEWVFPCNPVAEYHCNWFHDLAKLFGFVPEFCMGCWKVVVRPRNVDELIRLLILQNQMVEKDPECYCKCGIELRPYVFGNYGGYFYTRSLEDGLARYKQVREEVDKAISPDVPVILKRYCTEFELDFGPTLTYKLPDRAEKIEAMIKEHCYMAPFTYKQPQLLITKIMREWIKFAWDRGDTSVYRLTDGKPLVREVCTYHNTKEEK